MKPPLEYKNEYASKKVTALKFRFVTFHVIYRKKPESWKPAFNKSCDSLLNDPGGSNVFMSEETSFQRADGFSERLGELLQLEYQLKPSDRRRLNYVITKHKEAAVKKVKRQLKILNDHDSTLFQANIWHYQP